MNNIVVLAWNEEKIIEAKEVLKQFNILYITGYELSDERIAGLKNTFDKIEIIDCADMKSESYLISVIKRWSDNIFRIITMEELCLIMAAKLRESLNIDGDRIQDVLKFRDKLLMLDCVKKAILTPKTEKIKTKEQIKNFAKKNGKSFIKPTLGVGSKRCHTINKDTDIDELRIDLERRDYIIQEYIEGRFFHCDGVSIDGNLYCFNTMEYLEKTTEMDRPYFRSVSVFDNGLYQKLKTDTQNVIAVMPHGKYVFHAEFFERNGEIIFCEIAKRSGGAAIVPLMQYIYGINLNEIMVKIMINEDFDLPDNKIHDKYFAYILYHPFNGIVKKIEGLEYLSNEFVFYKEVNIKENSKMEDAIYSSEAIIMAALYGDTKKEVNERLLELTNKLKIVIS